jgi:uncharacterized protein YkwD
MKNRADLKKILFILALTAAACFSERRADALEIRARNDFDKQLEIAVVYYDDAAASWMTIGWYNVAAGKSRTVKFTTSKQDIYIHAWLWGENTMWGRGDITRVVVSEAFKYRDAEECPVGTNRRSVKFTKFTAKNGDVSYHPVMDTKPLPNAGGAAAPAKNAGDGKFRSASFSAQAGALIELINHKRRVAGTAELRTDENLMKAAARRAAELAKKYDHTRPDGREYHTVMPEFGLNPVASAENVTCRGDDSALEVNEQFVNSAGHKKNMLNAAYSRVGVGVYRDGKKYYWVELFAGEEVSASSLSGQDSKNLGESLKELEQSLKELGELFR